MKIVQPKKLTASDLISELKKVPANTPVYYTTGKDVKKHYPVNFVDLIKETQSGLSPEHVVLSYHPRYR